MFSAKNMLPSEQFETPMNMEITIVKTFCDLGHNFFKKVVSILSPIFWRQQIGWSYCTASLMQFE